MCVCVCIAYECVQGYMKDDHERGGCGIKGGRHKEI